MLVTFSTTAKSPPSWLSKQMLDLENCLKNENKVLLNRAVLKTIALGNLMGFLVLPKPQSIPAVIFLRAQP